ncbi:DUF6680 family protein [Klebsiella aerogenes]|uniref:DUF6680 family protein n=1 Tax=Klebsiella aerogenes TaxID=548 RepID=UPI002DBEA197|nr:DUF6680 family protein [Klebsiella aerogenes]
MCDLLSAIAKDIGYDFERVQLQTAIYSPIAHGEIENDQLKRRRVWHQYSLTMDGCIVLLPLSDKEEKLTAELRHIQQSLKSVNGTLQHT